MAAALHDHAAGVMVESLSEPVSEPVQSVGQSVSELVSQSVMQVGPLRHSMVQHNLNMS